MEQIELIVNKDSKKDQPIALSQYVSVRYRGSDKKSIGWYPLDSGCPYIEYVGIWKTILAHSMNLRLASLLFRLPIFYSGPQISDNGLRW
jgi:hypothetical protein